MSKIIFDKTKDSLNLVNDIIEYCRAWGLWKDVCIYTDGKCYTDSVNDSDINRYTQISPDVYVRDENDPDKYLTGLTDAGTYDEAKSEYKNYSNPEHLLDMTYEGPLYMLIRHGQLEVEIKDLSEKAKVYIGITDTNIEDEITWRSEEKAYDYIESKCGWDPVKYDSYSEFLSLENQIDYDEKIFNNSKREFSSRDEYQDFLSKAIASKESTLTQYFADEVEDEILEEFVEHKETYFDEGSVASHVSSDFFEIFKKYGLWAEPGFDWSLTAYRL